MNVRAALENKLLSLLKEGVTPDVITFAGNGEPTMHPEFEVIVDDTVELRNIYFPDAKISVLTNGMHLERGGKVLDALKKVENPILKLDSAFDKTAKLINRPNSHIYRVAKQVENYKRFQGNFILQTMFIRGGEFEGEVIDNTTEEEISAWLELVRELKPREVMIYTIDRETPVKTLEKVPLGDLLKLPTGREVRYKTNVAG